MGAHQNVFVVEDDASMRRAVLRFLYAAGYFPIAYESAEAFLGDGPPRNGACMVVDLKLPGMSGLELAERLAGSSPSIPIIFITAHDDQAFRDRAGALGHSEYLLKPFEGTQLVDAIGRLAPPEPSESAGFG